MTEIRTCDICNKGYPEKTGAELRTIHWWEGNKRMDYLYLCNGCYKKHLKWWSEQVKETNGKRGDRVDNNRNEWDV